MTGTSTADDESTRYTRRSILRSERMYGTGFQSPGRLAAMDAFCARLPMRRGMSILDIGSGLGGAAFYFGGRYDAHVLGIDIAPAMIEISRERLAAMHLPNVSFVAGDIRTVSLPAASFDLAWSRDCILYIADKTAVWQAVSRSLRPGGHVFITDFCRTPTTLSAEFRLYLERCDYHLQDIASYAAGLEATGLEVLTREDATDQFIAHLEDEQSRLVAGRAAFLRDFDEDDYQYLITRWDKKLAFCRSGDFRWGLFIARKRG